MERGLITYYRIRKHSFIPSMYLVHEIQIDTKTKNQNTHYTRFYQILCHGPDSHVSNDITLYYQIEPNDIESTNFGIRNIKQ